MKQTLLGQKLVEAGVISPTQLEDALQLQKQSGGALGEILFRTGACNGLKLHQHLADQQQLPFADLVHHPPEGSLLNADSLGEYLGLEVIPWQIDPITGAVILATPRVDDQVRRWAERYFPHHHYAVTSPRDIRQALARHFSDIFSRLSRDQLLRLFPEQSAHATLMRRQRYWIWGSILCLTTLFMAVPQIAWLILLCLCNSIYFATLFFKMIIFAKGLNASTAKKKKVEPLLSDATLPRYTILIPLYREAKVLPQIVHAMRNLDYPPQKLDIKLVLEADDTETLSAARALQPEGRFDILAVPPSEPRTKPKACNYALRFAYGDIITIYDAEDIPDPQQLRKVVAKFRSSPLDTVCVQCRLNYYNRDKNLLTRLFALEYACWFDFMLPGLEMLALPIPLGGTSNHIARDRLMALGEWDPYNVTEDADLGIRFAAAKYRTVTCSSLTMEEAPSHLWAWIKQRSRWVKGYLQTWLVHMRRPLWLYRRLGWRAFIGFQLFIGGPCFVFLSAPLLMVLSFIWLISDSQPTHPATASVMNISLGILVYGIALHFTFSSIVIKKHGWKKMRAASFIFPFYWILHSIASFRGLWQLFTRPHYWDKTEHGDEIALPSSSEVRKP